MRVTATDHNFKVHAVAGTYVVMFGYHLPQAECGGLLGFSLHRVDHTENEAYYLEAMKIFAATDPGFPPGSLHSTRDHPIQSFQWADYSAKPAHDYTYTITALKGTPQNLVPYASASFDIRTESPDSGIHDVYFNRGLAASQAYVRRFGDRRPEEVVNRAAFAWLSRGLNEALENYITSCDPDHHALRIAAYEFNYGRFLQLVKDTVATGVDIQVIYDARRDYPKADNLAAIAAFGLGSHCIARTQPKSYISHNKFIIKLQDGVPVSVWTGGTNFSEGGIYGHSNVAQVVEDPAIAARFLDYWNALAADPPSAPLKAVVEAISPLPAGRPTVGTTAIFSPRSDLSALQWYADLARAATDGLFMTFAFGMNDLFKEVYQNSQSTLRYALLERKTRPMRNDDARAAEEGRIQALRNMKENIFAVGSFIPNNEIDGWVKERLSGLNSHVRYIHNKFMLLDPLSEDPIVIVGSANFSDASTRRNDENMVVVRGDKATADIYLGEFMRLYSHHAFRESLQWRDPDDPPRPLRTDDWWRDYFGDTDRSVRREFFARL
jgi:phosphatidylserine/phosphatidylglycerophosphate/cardiolipin synthase-like enzyme